MHSPEPRLLDEFVRDGYDLLLAGHTYGGQPRLPWYGTLVTNCGIDRQRARGLHRYPAWRSGLDARTAGLGTSPWAPARFACRPEASLLTLVPRDPAEAARVCPWPRPALTWPCPSGSTFPRTVGVRGADLGAGGGL